MTRATDRSALELEPVMDDLREVLRGVAGQIALMTGAPERVAGYLGVVPGSDIQDIPVEGSLHGIDRVELERFPITERIAAAFAFALQKGSMAARLAGVEDDWADLIVLRDGGPRCGGDGTPTALAHEDSPLRRVIDMALGRRALLTGRGISIRQMSLLADVAETSVRSSISTQGIRAEGRPARVAADPAKRWLQKRRGYVPALTGEGFESARHEELHEWVRQLPVPEALHKIMHLRGLEAVALAGGAGVAPAWLEGLLEGRKVDEDLDALARVAEHLGIDVPTFVGRAVTGLLTR